MLVFSQIMSVLRFIYQILFLKSIHVQCRISGSQSSKVVSKEAKKGLLKIY
jgi:hypothetical protein